MHEVSGSQMRRETEEFMKLMAGGDPLAENIDSISREDCQAEGELFLHIAGGGVNTRSRVEAQHYRDDEIQKMDSSKLANLIIAKTLTYAQVDNALEKIKAFSKLDRIGDVLAKHDLKGG